MRATLYHRGWTHVRASEELGCARATIARWTSPDPRWRRLPTPAFAKKLHEVLDIQVAGRVSVVYSSLRQNGSPIRVGRLKKRWTQARLAQTVGVSRSAICSWEKGTLRPSPENTVKLNKILGLKLVVERDRHPRQGNKAINGSIIRARRLELGLRQRELADRLGVSIATICRWESGNPVVPERVFAVSAALQMPPEDVPVWKPTPPPDYAHPIRKRRYEMGMTQVQLAAKVKVPRWRVYRWENFEAWPTQAEAERVSRRLKLPVSVILTGEDEN